MNSARRPHFVILIAAAAALRWSSWADAQTVPRPAIERPNFVVLLCDNLGYGDTQPFGSEVNREKLA